MARPIEFVDLKTTSVTVERELLEKARAKDMNISEILRNALATELREAPGKVDGKLKKFKGLPRHIVTKAKNNIIEDGENAKTTASWLNDKFGVNCTVEDLNALIPRF